MSNEPSTSLLTVPWDEFMTRRFRPQQGEHILLVGPTRSGKSYLAKELLGKRKYVVVLDTKPRDRSMVSDLTKRGFRVTKTWPPNDELSVKWIFKPALPVSKHLSAAQAKVLQRTAVEEMLKSVYEAGGWTVNIDELLYVRTFLGISDEVEVLYYQGASNHITPVSSAQRPAWIPRIALSSSTHCFFFKTNDPADLLKLRDLSGSVRPAAIAAILSTLPKFHALYVDTRNGDMAVVCVEPKK